MGLISAKIVSVYVLFPHTLIQILNSMDLLLCSLAPDTSKLASNKCTSNYILKKSAFLHISRILTKFDIEQISTGDFHFTVSIFSELKCVFHTIAMIANKWLLSAMDPVMRLAFLVPIHTDIQVFCDC